MYVSILTRIHCRHFSNILVMVGKFVVVVSLFEYWSVLTTVGTYLNIMTDIEFASSLCVPGC